MRPPLAPAVEPIERPHVRPRVRFARRHPEVPVICLGLYLDMRPFPADEEAAAVAAMGDIIKARMLTAHPEVHVCIHAQRDGVTRAVLTTDICDFEVPHGLIRRAFEATKEVSEAALRQK